MRWTWAILIALEVPKPHPDTSNNWQMPTDLSKDQDHVPTACDPLFWTKINLSCILRVRWNNPSDRASAVTAAESIPVGRRTSEGAVSKIRIRLWKPRFSLMTFSLNDLECVRWSKASSFRRRKIRIIKAIMALWMLLCLNAKMRGLLKALSMTRRYPTPCMMNRVSGENSFGLYLQPSEQMSMWLITAGIQPTAQVKMIKNVIRAALKRNKR